MFFRTVGMCALMTLGVAAAGSDAAAREYSYQIIKVDLHDGGKVVALNNNGMVLGNFGQEGHTGVFTWQAGKVTKYRRLRIQGYGLNDAGDFVGSYGSTAFVHSGGKYVTIGYPGYGAVAATGINNSGTVVGIYVCGRNPEYYCGFRYSAGAYTSFPNQQISAINQEGDMIAQFGITPITAGILITPNGDIHNVEGVGAGSLAAALNDNGEAVGEYDMGYIGSFSYSKGATTYFAAPACVDSTVFTGINNADQIVGACSDGTAPFVYQNGAFTNLNTVRGHVLQPVAINNRGQILANTAGGFSVLATPK